MFPYNIVDLSHALSSTIPEWNSSNSFICENVHDYNEFGFRVQKLNMMAGIGTHMDAPSHAGRNPLTIADIPLSDLMAPCVVIDVSAKAHENYSVSASDILDFEKKCGPVSSEMIVIIRTGWDRFWITPEWYRNNHHFPSISKEAAEFLLSRNIRGLGVDTLSPDRPEDAFIVHSLFSKASKFLIENVAHSDKLPQTGAFCVCLPMKIEGSTEAPVRLVGLIPEGQNEKIRKVLSSYTQALLHNDFEAMIALFSSDAKILSLLTDEHSPSLFFKTLFENSKRNSVEIQNIFYGSSNERTAAAYISIKATWLSTYPIDFDAVDIFEFDSSFKISKLKIVLDTHPIKALKEKLFAHNTGTS